MACRSEVRGRLRNEVLNQSGARRACDRECGNEREWSSTGALSVRAGWIRMSMWRSTGVLVPCQAMSVVVLCQTLSRVIEHGVKVRGMLESRCIRIAQNHGELAIHGREHEPRRDERSQHQHREHERSRPMPRRRACSRGVACAAHVELLTSMSHKLAPCRKPFALSSPGSTARPCDAFLHQLQANHRRRTSRGAPRRVPEGAETDLSPGSRSAAEPPDPLRPPERGAHLSGPGALRSRPG